MSESHGLSFLKATLACAKMERDAAILKVEKLEELIKNGGEEESEEGPKKKRKMPVKLDVNGNPIAKKKTAYNVFIKEVMNDKSDGQKGFSDAAAQWNKMSADDKAGWTVKADEINKKEEETRLALGSSGAVPTTPQTEVVANEGSNTKSAKSEKKKKKKKDKKNRKDSMGSEVTFD